MELVIEPYDYFPCELETFTINGKKASSVDFGDTFDHKKEENTYGCNNKYFEPKPPTKKALHKYNITKEEYYSICNELENKLHIGKCGCCYEW